MEDGQIQHKQMWFAFTLAPFYPFLMCYCFWQLLKKDTIDT